MKFATLIFLGISLMAQEKIPYPYPNYDDDLLAKEIINGTYYASIQMMIKNTQTGAERYISVPDSITDKMERGGRVDSVTATDIDPETTIYDRDKMLEDAVLPKYVDINDDLPIIVSYAQCPQKLTYVSTLNLECMSISRYDDGINKFLVAFEKTYDGSSSEDAVEDVYTLWKIVGSQKIELFHIVHSVRNDDGWIDSSKTKFTPLWLYSTHGRNFMYGDDNKLYEYGTSGYTELLPLNSIMEKIIVVDDGRYYAVSHLGNELTLYDIDAKRETTITTKYAGTGVGDHHWVSAYDSNMFFSEYSNVMQIKDGMLTEIVDYKPWEKSNIKMRFEYLFNNLVTDFNMKNGHPKIQNASRSSDRLEKLVGIQEGYISIFNNEIHYSPDYKNSINSKIPASSVSEIVITEDYIYFYDAGRLVIVAVDGWSTKILREEYAEFFAKNKMLDSQNKKARIGD